MKPERKLIALLLAAVVWLAACGVKGPPRPPVVNSPAADAGVAPDGGE